jgi:nicotinamide mononucleotide transporter
MDIIEQIIHEIKQVSLWEWLAVMGGLLYIFLVLFKKTSAWLFGVLSSAVYIKICFQTQLYLDGILQLFYVIIGVYGWWIWQSKKEKEARMIQKWKLIKHIWSFTASSLFVLIIGFLFDHYTEQAKPYIDAMITIFSLLATYMVAHKVLENWLYWIFIDAISVYLFASRGLYLTSLLYVVYALMAILGFFKWRWDYKHQKQ